MGNMDEGRECREELIKELREEIKGLSMEQLEYVLARLGGMERQEKKAG